MKDAEADQEHKTEVKTKLEKDQASFEADKEYIDIEVSTETKAKTEGDMSDTTDSMNEDKYLAEATLCRLRARSP